MEVTFKTASNDDRYLLLSLTKEFYQIEHLTYNVEVLNKCFDEIFTNDNLATIWIIYIEREPAGYVVLTFGYSLEFHGRDALIDEFYIRESYRSQGIGKQTLEFVLTTCQTLGIKAVHLEVSHENNRAKTIYQKAGFVAHDRYFMTKWINS
ncbi:GNAT family N-acetyltransferase [[Phormidium ambiguum] IAM M-71]|uniref:GNAT family N-acetyltransferase n=1 Tax=[Phormidium ambiguum] IAM M-71 TaxID=454136 RepID=A0A1U7IIW3_9CYAN|nr:GNAT family N-acetyltransferase [Phormidium ambiguum]OKH37115.1 GNAT family N-acetyltransferase [Phormidium ambiguum IAM M-71]